MMSAQRRHGPENMEHLRLWVMVLFFVHEAIALNHDQACSANPCQNEGSCIPNTTSADPGAYFCECEPGWSGANCETNIDDCVGACSNNATCTDLVNGFRCDCPLGFSGNRCENVEYWTLQQWTGNECAGTPWRCFRLQMNRCIDTGWVDGNVPTRKTWFGRLRYDSVSLKYSIDLCWGQDEDDPEESCNCENHYEGLRRLGKNSLGPVSAPGVRDSDRCHKLKRVTSSRLVNSTGMNLHQDENKKNVDCSAEGGAVRMVSTGLAFWGVLVITIQLMFSAEQ